MKRFIACFLAVVLACLCFSGCNTASLIPDLYTKIVPVYVAGIDKMNIDEAKAAAEEIGLELEKTDVYKYKVSDTKWEAIISFEPLSDKLEKIEFERVGGNKESINITKSSVFFSSMDELYRSFDNLGDCEEYIFGGKSGVEYVVEKETPSTSSTYSSTKPSNSSSQTFRVSLKHGKLLDTKINGTVLVIKAKIEPSYNNKATVDQNYYNIENIIKKQCGSRFKEIQYWAVADMTSGSEQKVISFTVSEDVIKKIADDKIVANQMGKYVDDLFIHASLR